ncbi:MAG: acyltransferase domain-containing protein [Actinomycetota bacterium]|nr:acyltransferase domain-containing protein [Actinomycetota bacterium]
MSERAPTAQRELLEQALRQLREARARLADAQRVRHEPIAIIGAGVRTPGGVDHPDALWSLLRDGTDAVAPLVNSVDGHRSDPDERDANGHSAGLLSTVDEFDADFFGISAAEAAHMDPQQRLVLETAWEATEDAGLPVERLRERSTGVFLGIYGGDYLTLQLSGQAEITAYTAPGAAHSVAANRLSYLFDLHGPSLAVDTACSSSLVAVHLACRALRNGDCDFAFVGGVNVILSPSSTLVTEKVMPIAPGGRCRTFDAEADGIVRGEGCGVLVLERMSDATAEHRPIRGIIRGTAVNHNGRTNGLTAPNPTAQSTLMRRALADASADPRDVVYIEAHGTGTRLGDPIEMEALRDVYGEGDTPCALGSVKTNFGHQEAAAGITGLIKAMLVLEHGEVPPHLHFEQLNPEIDLYGTRLVVPTECSSLPDVQPRLAAVSSFGFGGANSHAVLEQPPARKASIEPARGVKRLVLPLSARSAGALGELAERYADYLEASDPVVAPDVCAVAAVGRTHHPYRLCFSAGDQAELVTQLRKARTAHVRPAASAPRLAFVFSGQGSQWAAMGREILVDEPVVRAEVAGCDVIVHRLAGWSVIEQLKAAHDASRLHETAIAQVSIGVLQLGLTALWRSWGIEPSAVVGHSMGEIIAAAAAGALNRSAALKLLLRRAELTEKGARGGSMLSVALPASQVERLLARVGGRIGIGAVNGPRSTVVSGDPSAVAQLEAAAARLGANTRRLQVEYAFHSPLLDGLADELADAAPQPVISPPEITLYSTVTGARVNVADLDGMHWMRNLRQMVAFQPVIEAMARDGITTFIEVGPHPVLLKDINEIAEGTGTAVVTVGSLQREQSAQASLHRSLANLYRAGLEIHWEAVTGRPAAHCRLPTYPWQRTRHWLPLVDKRETVIEHSGITVSNPDVDASPAVTVGADLVDDLLGYVRERIAQTQGLASAHEVPIDQRLDGLDSLVIVELKNQIEGKFGISVPLQALLEASTPILLVRAITATFFPVDTESRKL